MFVETEEAGPASASLSEAAVNDRRRAVKQVSRLAFRVSSLYGISRGSVRLPLNGTASIDSGTICLTCDPEADPASNIGLIEYDRKRLTVRYGVQIIFPGLFELVSSRSYDPSLLHPIRAVATDECSITEDLLGFRALGCLDFLPGSLWSGASGG